MEAKELIPLTEAARRLGVSRVTMARLVREGIFTVYLNPLDRRQKLINAAELDEIRPRPASERQEKTAA